MTRLSRIESPATGVSTWRGRGLKGRHPQQAAVAITANPATTSRNSQRGAVG